MKEFAIILRVNNDMLKKMIYWVFPYYETITANKKISEKVKDLKRNIDNDENYLSPYMKDFKGIAVKEAESIFNSVMSNRKSLEEKARVNVLIVTIAVTVILGLSSFLFTIQENIPDSQFINTLLGILFVFSLVYLISGSISSLATLNAGESKEIYNMSPADYKYFATIPQSDDRDKEIVYFYSRYAELNTTINWKINNYISCSYANIRNALFTLGIIGILFCFIFVIDKDEKSILLENELNKQLELLETIEYELSILQEETRVTNEENIDQITRRQEYIVNEIDNISEALEGLKNQ